MKNLENNPVITNAKAIFGGELEALGPATGVVIDAHNFQCVVANSVGDNKRGFGNDKLPRSGNTAGMTQLRIFGQKVLDAI
jgi:hypothetical protein